MSENADLARRAEGKIRLGITRLADDYPFHAAVLERVRVQDRPAVSTIGVTVSGDAILLVYDPGFVLSVTVDELEGVLLHEVHHVVLGHVLTDPADFPDEWARTVAEEVSANEFIKRPLPGDPITLDQFPALPPLESTQRRYDRLRKVRKRSQVLACDAAPDGPGTLGAPGGASSVGPGGSPEAARATRGGARAGRQRPPGRTIDDHSVWGEARRDPDRARQSIREVIQEALLEVGAGRLPDDLEPAVRDLGIGCNPGIGRLDLQGGEQGRIDWRLLLRRYVGRDLEERPVFTRPPRRFPELLGILPGRRRQAARPHILAVLDTSGSMTDRLLEQVDAELARLARRFTVVVVECDAAIQRVYPYRKLVDLVGRGGTDFRPALEPTFLRQHRADLVVFFTDGYGPAPTEPPRVPVVWCLTECGQPPAAWGRVIQME
jgi:predicted metal-dependent peptidase